MNITEFLVVLTFIVAFKSLTIGGDFNFLAWKKYGKQYTQWYFNRQTSKRYKGGK